LPPRYTTLHYLVQYQIIEASRVIARMLLQGEARRTRNVLLKRVYSCCAVEQSYAGASQLALDMLLKVDAHEELIMVLLQRQQVIPALKYVRERGIVVPAASFLKVAKDTRDNSTRPLPSPHPGISSRDFSQALQPYFSLFSSTLSLLASPRPWRRSRFTMCAACTRRQALSHALLQESCAEYVKYFNETFCCE
jgi:hypothetical protein